MGSEMCIRDRPAKLRPLLLSSDFSTPQTSYIVAHNVAVALLRIDTNGLAILYRRYRARSLRQVPQPVQGSRAEPCMHTSVSSISRLMATTTLQHSRSHVPTSFLCDAERLTTSPQLRPSIVLTSQRCSASGQLHSVAVNHEYIKVDHLLSVSLPYDIIPSISFVSHSFIHLLSVCDLGSLTHYLNSSFPIFQHQQQ